MNRIVYSLLYGFLWLGVLVGASEPNELEKVNAVEKQLILSLLIVLVHWIHKKRKSPSTSQYVDGFFVSQVVFG